VQHVTADRADEETNGSFGERIASLDADVVIDLTCYMPESAVQICEALRGRVGHLLHCGTVWVHGHSVEVPTREDAPRSPFGEYGIRKAALEAYLLRESHRSGMPVTVLHPGHLVGPGWNPINPQGNFNPDVFSALRRGDEITLPNLGMETVHHVHADDVAQAFVCALQRRSASLGESFHIVSPAALTLRGYAALAAGLFGQEASVRYIPYEEWRGSVSEKDARSTWDHIAHSPNCSIEKARTLLGYAPRYRSMEAVAEAVQSMIARGVIID
jgi:nucleoside-diphosphate-sugar epimerase